MLRKVSEIYDWIGFAGVGKYNEFDQLRIAGIRHADLKGSPSAERTSTPAAWPTSTPRSRPGLHP